MKLLRLIFMIRKYRIGASIKVIGSQCDMHSFQYAVFDKLWKMFTEGFGG